jgi:hypothetical protein
VSDARAPVRKSGRLQYISTAMQGFAGTWTRFCGEFEEAVLEIYLGAATARKIATSRKYQEVVQLNIPASRVPGAYAEAAPRENSSADIHANSSYEEADMDEWTLTISQTCDGYTSSTVFPFSVIPASIRINGRTYDVSSTFEQDSMTLITRRVASAHASAPGAENYPFEVIETRRLLQYPNTTQVNMMEVNTVIRRIVENNRKSVHYNPFGGTKLQCGQSDINTRVSESVCIQWFCDEHSDPELAVNHVDMCFSRSANVHQRNLFDLKAPITSERCLDISQIMQELRPFVTPLYQYVVEHELFDGSVWLVPPQCTPQGSPRISEDSTHVSNKTSSRQHHSYQADSARVQGLLSYLPGCYGGQTMTHWSVHKNGCVHNPALGKSVRFALLKEAHLYDLVIPIDHVVFREFSFLYVVGATSVLGWEMLPLEGDDVGSIAADAEPVIGQLRRRVWLRVLVPISTPNAGSALDPSDPEPTLSSSEVSERNYPLVAALDALAINKFTRVSGASPVILRGILFKRGEYFRKAWRRRMFVLRADCNMYYYNVDGNVPVLKGCFHLSQISVVMALAPENCFQRYFGIGLVLRATASHTNADHLGPQCDVRDSYKTRYLAAVDATQHLKWLHFLSKCITLSSLRALPPATLFPFCKSEIIYSGELYLEGRERNDWSLCKFELTQKELRYTISTNNATVPHETFYNDNIFDIVHCAYTDSPSEPNEFSLSSLSPASSRGVGDEHRNVLRLLAPSDVLKQEWRNAIRMLVSNVELCVFSDEDEQKSQKEEKEHPSEYSEDVTDTTSFSGTLHRDICDVHEIESLMSETNMGITSATSSVHTPAQSEDEGDNETIHNPSRRNASRSRSLVSSITKSFRRLSRAASSNLRLEKNIAHEPIFNPRAADHVDDEHSNKYEHYQEHLSDGSLSAGDGAGEVEEVSQLPSSVLGSLDSCSTDNNNFRFKETEVRPLEYDEISEVTMSTTTICVKTDAARNRESPEAREAETTVGTTVANNVEGEVTIHHTTSKYSNANLAEGTGPRMSEVIPQHIARLISIENINPQKIFQGGTYFCDNSTMM